MTVEEFKNKLKPLVKDKQFIMSRKARQELSALGFTMHQGRVHYMLVLKGKKRDYKFPVAVTCSDKRAGLNFVTCVANTLKREEGDLWK